MRFLLEGIRAYTVERKQRFMDNIQDTLPLLPKMGRKPAVVRYWLLSARKAQVVLLIALLILPALVPAAIEGVLEQIYPPQTSQHFFGLLQKTTGDARVEQSRQITLLVLWVSAVGLVLGLLWAHIPKALGQAERRAREMEDEADSICDTAPSRSVLLYRSAVALVTDFDREGELKRKLGQLDQHYLEEIAAVKRSAADAGPLGTRVTGSPDKTVVVSGAQQPDVPVVAVGPDKRYHLEVALGRGAMGVVYRARDIRLDRPVALKQLFAHGGPEAEALRRFRQEAKVLARLSHPNIVQVYDFLEEDTGTWIAMELIEGEDLEWHLSDGAFPPKDIARRGMELADALGYAHDKGVVHRDFKPGNVLIDGYDRCKISDFGIAKLSESSMHTQVGTILGSPAYMSPEQAKGSEVDARTDIYALGVTLFRMATGRLPFQGDTRSVLAQVLTQDPPSPRDFNASIPKKLDALILRMMAKDPAERPSSMAEVKAILESCQKSKWSRS